MNKKWQETRLLIDIQVKNVDKNILYRKASEELETLRDLHEGYNRYIKTVEILSTDPQKLYLQLETNKVNFIKKVFIFKD